MKHDSLTVDLENAIKKGKKLKISDIFAVPSLAANPLTKTILKIYTNDNEIRFRDLVSDLRMLVSKNPLDIKLKFLFNIYDTDGDGFICNFELYDILEILSENRMDGSKLQNIVDQTFRECKTDFIDFQTFSELLHKRTKNIETYFIAKN
ncbi:hypothetical protein GVAV_000493 [Gurleya vavrai]